jgi:hypothetical protein
MAIGCGEETWGKSGCGRRDGHTGRGGLSKQGNLRRGQTTAAAGKSFCILHSSFCLLLAARARASLLRGCNLRAIPEPRLRIGVNREHHTLARRTQGFSSRRGLFSILHFPWLWGTSSGVEVHSHEPTPFRPLSVPQVLEAGGKLVSIVRTDTRMSSEFKVHGCRVPLPHPQSSFTFRRRVVSNSTASLRLTKHY